MRKRRIVWATCRIALLSLAMAGAVAGRAAAQSNGTPWLGVTTQQITDGLRDGLDYQGTGVIVNRVVNDSPADRAGIRKGDVIVNFNSRVIDSPDELSDVVRAGRVGQTVSVTVVRDGSRRTLSARLAEWPEDMGNNDGNNNDSDNNNDEWETPTPPRAPTAPRAPSAPRAPRAPETPRAYRFEWNGDDLEHLQGNAMGLLQTMGRGRLGVQVQDLNPGLGDALGVPDGEGVLVIEVLDDTPAKRAGLKAGDVITRVGDASVGDAESLRRALRDRDGHVSITVMRKGARRTVDAELEAKDDTRRDVIRMRRGDSPTIMRIPNVRSRTLRDRSDSDADRSDMEQELRQLRQELRDLREKMEALDRK